MARNQRLNATITIGSALDASVRRNVGFLRSGLNQVGDSIKEVERRQRELGRQRRVLERNGESVAELDREYEKLERTMIDLRRQQERWNRAAAASRRAGSTFNNMVSDIGRNVRRIGVGAGIAGAAILGLASSTATLGDGVAKTADAIGIGTAELQELRYAAELAGVGTTAFDTALEKMTKNIGLALEGTGAQSDALDALGLSAEDLANMRTEDALGAIADAMGGVTTQAERAAIANDLFGRGGLPMLNMLRDGTDGLNAMRDAARETGYVLSEEAVRDAEVFQDTMLRTKLVLAGLKNTFGAELMPVVTDSMRRIGDSLLTNREDVVLWAENFADGVESAIPIIGDVVDGLIFMAKKTGVVVGAVAEMVGGWRNFGMVIGAVLASRTIYRVFQFGSAVVSLGRAMWGIATAGPVAAGAIRAVGAALFANPIGVAIAAIAGGALAIFRNWSDVAPWFRARWSEVTAVFQGFAGFVGGVFTGDLSRAWTGIKTMWGGASGWFRGMWQGVGAVFTWAYDTLIKPVTDALGWTDAIEGAWAGLGSALSTTLSAIGAAFTFLWDNTVGPVVDKLSATGGIGAAWETVKSALDPVLTWIGTQFDRLMGLIQPVIDALTWVMDNASAVGTAISEALPERRNNVPVPGMGPRAGSQTGTPQRALGGQFPAGPVIVGERGPELRYENRAGYVAHNRSMRNMADYARRVGSSLEAARSAGNRRARPQVVSKAVRVHLDAPVARAAAPQREAAGDVTHNYYEINAAGADAQEVIRLLRVEERRNRGGQLFDRAPATGMHGR